VTVTATNSSTGFNRTVITEVDGTYRFQSLPVGTYEVTADLSGFGTLTTRNVEVNVSTARTLNITLKQATVKEQITVTAASPLIETDAGHRHGGQPARNRQPATERTPVREPWLARAGHDPVGQQRSDQARPAHHRPRRRQRPQCQLPRRRRRQHRRHHRRALQNYNIEAVQEFNIQTQQYKAEYGRTTGGVLTVVTKTGTNDFEGKRVRVLSLQESQ